MCPKPNPGAADAATARNGAVTLTLSPYQAEALLEYVIGSPYSSAAEEFANLVMYNNPMPLYAKVTAAREEIDRIHALAESLGWGDVRLFEGQEPREFTADREWLRTAALRLLQSEGDMVENVAAQIDDGENDVTLDTIRPYVRRVVASLEILDELGKGGE
ncbi:MAG: hypothetical protein M3N16_03375 [Actinomycetota bacterium]|nr:hypothetical protein [Actinomycetota bacterium]